jgi:hypothetical protein
MPSVKARHPKMGRFVSESRETISGTLRVAPGSA